MLDISLAGLIGAIAGTAVAGVTYHVFIGVLERRMLAQAPLQTAEERGSMDVKLSLMRRVVLTTDLFVFAAIGYWIGHSFWG